MKLKELIRRTFFPRVAGNGERTPVVEGPKRAIALVIAEPELASVISELYQACGYDVFVPETPLDVIETLVAVGDQVRAVLISSEAAWANGLRELIADEFPKIDRVRLVS